MPPSDHDVEAGAGMQLVVNFGHPITPAQRLQIATYAGARAVRVIDIVPAPVQFDMQQPLEGQVAALVDSVDLTPEEWQSEGLVVNLPGHATGAAILLAELHGRTGHFPSILLLRPVPGKAVTVYEVAPIINLQELRNEVTRLRR